MSVASVRSEISKAMALKRDCMGALIDQGEAKSIRRAATSDGKVTVGEAKQVIDLFERAVKLGPAEIATAACPENPSDVPVLDVASAAVLNAFFRTYNLPGGDNADKILKKIESTLARSGWGQRLARRPNLRGTLPIQIPPPPLSADFPSLTAHYNPKAKTFILQVSASWPQPNEQWYAAIPA